MSVRRRAFTLLELLLVIAILGILAGILAPTLQRMRGRAKSTQCLANLRQLGLAVSMYVDENGGKLPCAEQRPTTPIDSAHVLPRICDALAPQVGTNSFVFRCPMDRAAWFEKEGSSYEWSYVFNGQPLQRVTIGPSWDPHELPADEVNLMFDYENFHSSTGGTNGTKNVLYGDGHVAPL